MNIYSRIDLRQWRLNSLFFRLILLCYSFFICSLYDNIFKGWVYVVGCIVYVFAFLFLMNSSKLRLTNDFLLIGFILAGKDPANGISLVFILLPIINAVNYSGRNRSSLLYIYTILTFLVLVLYNRIGSYEQEDTFFQSLIRIFDVIINSWPVFLTVLILLAMEFYTFKRGKLTYFREEINDEIDSLYTDIEISKKPYKVYSRIISIINKNIKKSLVQDIFCFKVATNKDDLIVVVNGSRIIVNTKFHDNDYLESLRKNEKYIDAILEIDGRTFNSNFSIYVKEEEEEYIFVFVTSSSIPVYYEIVSFHSFLVPSLTKMAKHLLSEKHFRDKRRKEFGIMANRRLYVTRATKAMHFIRNRLGSLKNLIKLLENKKNFTGAQRSRIEKIITKETRTANRELEIIVERANYMLNKNNNPFDFTSLVTVPLSRLFSMIKRNVGLFIPETEIKFNVEDKDLLVAINDEGMEIVLTDWLKNIEKYSNDFVEVNFNAGTEYSNIEFINNTFLDESFIDKLVQDMMSNDKNEILKRTTHGLFQIKTSLEEMGVSFKMEKLNGDDILIKFTIILKHIENENSSL